MYTNAFIKMHYKYKKNRSTKINSNGKNKLKELIKKIFPRENLPWFYYGKNDS